MINVGVIGHTGRLGKPLVEILNKHPHAEIVYTESRKEGVSGNLQDAEVVFLALPEGESVNYLGNLNGKKIIDLSNDNRCSYGWVYGLPEINREQIKFARYISNPGCYATSIILGLAPIKEKVSNYVLISSTSGISGAGMEVQKEDNFSVYKDGRQHKHLLEIENILDLKDILFVPQRIDVADRGIVSVIFAEYSGKGNLSDVYHNFYESAPFIEIVDSIETKNVTQTNFCDIKISKYGNKIIAISALDNLIKGGSGQAVQNFNIMCGFDETTGLL
ncbi:MAG: hypothetical protein AABW81_00835 [Nanoarchaeota archaeon]